MLVKEKKTFISIKSFYFFKENISLTKFELENFNTKYEKSKII